MVFFFWVYCFFFIVFDQIARSAKARLKTICESKVSDSKATVSIESDVFDPGASTSSQHLVVGIFKHFAFVKWYIFQLSNIDFIEIRAFRNI